MGAGAALAIDDCRSARVTVSDRFENGPQNCPASQLIRRTFFARDRCDHRGTVQKPLSLLLASAEFVFGVCLSWCVATGTQLIAVTDRRPPRVRARLVPLPPLAVSASQITLTPEQTKRLLLVLLELGKLGKGALLLGSKLGLKFGAGSGDTDLMNLMKGVSGADLSGASLNDLFGAEASSLLSTCAVALLSV
jgi:hypothetical protein